MSNLKLLWNFKTAKAYEDFKFSNLLTERHLCSSVLERYKVAQDQIHMGHNPVMSGWLAKHDKYLYFIPKKMIDDLPLRIGPIQEVVLQDGKHVRVLIQSKPFEIPAEKMMEFNELVDSISPYDCTDKDSRTLFKLSMITVWSSQCYIRICTESGFGKDSVNVPLSHLLRNYRMVQKMRTIPAILTELTPDGALIFNEACGNIKSEIVYVMEDVVNKIADGTPTYINGAKASLQHGTKDMYNIGGLGVACIFNDLKQYKDKKQYFDYQFENNGAIMDRLLPLKASGTLTDDYEQNIDFKSLAESEEAQQYFRKLICTLTYEKKHRSDYKLRWKHRTIILPNRHKQSFNQICMTIDMYAESQEEYTKFESLLYKWNKDYYKMLNGETITGVEERLAPIPLATSNLPYQTEFVKDNLTAIEKVFQIKPKLDYLEVLKVENGEQDIEKLLKEGSVIESPAGTFIYLN